MEARERHRKSEAVTEWVRERVFANWSDGSNDRDQVEFIRSEHSLQPTDPKITNEEPPKSRLLVDRLAERYLKKQ